MSNHEPLINDELEVAEAKHPLVDLLYDYTARVVMSRPGHYVYNKFDAGLSIVEKTAKWSLPQSPPSEEDTSKTTISAPPLIRPLPWILFLPALIALRMIRHSLSLMALLIGKQPVDPVTMVSSLQNFRRKLRAFKYRGLKLKRIQRAEKEAEPKATKQPKQANTLMRQIMFPLRYMICLVGFRSEITTTHRDHHHHHHHHHHRHQTKRPSEQPREVSQEPAANGPQRAEPSDLCPNKKRNAHERDADDSDSSLDEATVQELLEKYADAEADSSYHPSIALSSDSDSDIFESDKSQPEACAEDAEKHDPKKIKKESNGHAATNGKEPEPEAEKPHEPKPKSSLNTNANNGNPENGAAAPENQQKEEKTAEASQKSAGAGNESKPANESNPTKEPPQDVSSKNDNQNSSNKHSPTSMKEVKTNFHQKNKQQQHQQQHQIQPTQQHQQQHQQHQQQQQQHQHQQHQQQQCTAVNGGGGGRKHKKPHHYNAPHN